MIDILLKFYIPNFDKLILTILIISFIIILYSIFTSYLFLMNVIFIKLIYIIRFMKHICILYQCDLL